MKTERLLLQRDVVRNAPSPELVRPGSRARLVVLASEIGGLLRPGTFLSQLAKARSREEVPLLQRRWNKHGDSAGMPCSHVLLRRLSPLHFWNSDVHLARMVRVLPLMKWTPSSGMLGSRELFRQCA